MGFFQFAEILRRPVGEYLLRGDHDRALMALAGDRDIACAVAGENLLVGGVGKLKFQACSRGARPFADRALLG